jgi:hypothetical protein
MENRKYVANETPIAQNKGLSHFFGAVVLNRTNTKSPMEIKYPRIFKINTNPTREQKAIMRFLPMESERVDESLGLPFLIFKTARSKLRTISRRPA